MKIDYPFLVWIMVVVTFGLQVEVGKKRSMAEATAYTQLTKDGQFVQPQEPLESLYTTNGDDAIAKGFNQNCPPSEFEKTIHEELEFIIHKMRVSCPCLAKKNCTAITPKENNFSLGARNPGRRFGESLSDYLARMKLLKILGLKPKTSIALTLPSAGRHLAARNT